MKRGNTKWAVAALLVSLGAPLPARAQSIWNKIVCTSGSLVLCNEFDVVDNGSNSYSLTVTNNAAGSNISDYGWLSGVGIYGDASAYQFDITSATPAWTLIDYNTNNTGSISKTCNDIQSKNLLAGNCFNGDPGTNTQVVTITFTSNFGALGSSDFSTGKLLLAGDHVQSIGTLGCSGKFYSDGTVTTTFGTTLDGCDGPSTVTPEPATLLLLTTGLLGLTGARWIRRRQMVNA